LKRDPQKIPPEPLEKEEGQSCPDYEEYYILPGVAQDNPKTDISLNIHGVSVG
jgi:hypothetical protein